MSPCLYAPTAALDALSTVKRRGIEVALKTDKRESEKARQAALIEQLKAAGVSVEVSTQQRNLRHKFAVIDGQWVITGSFNWTANAEQRNRENLVVLNCMEMAEAFEREWRSMQQDAP